MSLKICLINSGCGHTQNRLGGFLHHIGAHYFHNPEDFLGGDYDLIFVESNCRADLGNKLGSAKVIAVDCEDDPNHTPDSPFFPILESRAFCYGKMVIDEQNSVSSLPQVMLPVEQYLWFNQVCEIDRPKLQNKTIYFLGVGSYIGKFNLKYPDSFSKMKTREVKDIKFLTETEDANYAYNQRYDWFLKFEQAGIDTDFGIVWDIRNLSLEGQQEYFGNIARFGKPRINYNQEIYECLNREMMISPTGFDRVSFRNFSLIAAGTPYLATDYGYRKMLYWPKHYIIVPDDENPVDFYQKGVDSEPFSENREVLKGLTVEKIWNKFIKQFN